MSSGLPPLIGLNQQLALRHTREALQRQDDEQAALRGSGVSFNLDMAVGPYWDRSVWEAYKAQFGDYPFGPGHKPPDVLSAPIWVKQLCGIRLNPAERMGGG